MIQVTVIVGEYKVPSICTVLSPVTEVPYTSHFAT